MAINLLTLINEYKFKRHNSFIIYGDSGIGKTAYLKEFISKNPKINISYINVIEEFEKFQSDQPVFEFNPTKFIKWVLSMFSITEQISKEAFIIDNFDFLINIWSQDERIDFLKQVGKYIEKSVIDIPVIFVLHIDPIIETQLDNSFIIKFSSLEALNNY